MESRGCFTGRKQTRHCGLCSFRFDANAAHHIVAGWSDFHRSLCDIHVRQFAKLVIHAWQFSFYILGGLVRGVEISDAMFRPVPLASLCEDCSRNDISCRELHLFGIVAFHEPFPILIEEYPAFAPYSLSNQNDM